MIKADFTGYRWMADRIKHKNYPLWKVLMPRHVIPPPGYASPQIAASVLATQLEVATRVSRGQIIANKPQIDAILLTWQLCENQVPTFFVGNDLITDLAESDVIADMKLSELEWPHDAMLFFLPEQFQYSYFGRPVPFVGVCRVQAGIRPIPDCLLKTLPTAHEMKQFGIQTDYSGQWAYVFSAPVFFPKGKSVDYSGSWPMDAIVGEVMKEANFIDATYQNRSGFLKQEDVPTKEEDLDIMNKIFAVTLFMLLLMNGEPEHIEPGAVTCHRKPAHAHEPKGENDLWSPNFIGRTYRSPSLPLGGTHASPRAHPRKGHWTRQVHGPGRSLRKKLWIKRMIVAAKPL